MSDVLLISLVFPSDNVSTAQIMGDLSADLRRYGKNVTVISTVPHYNPTKTKKESNLLKSRWGKILYQSKFRGIDVYHIYMPQKSGNKFWRLFWWIFFHLMTVIIGVTIAPRPSIIVAPSPPLTIGLSAWALGFYYKVPYIYNVQEIYPDIAIQLGIISNQYLIKFLYRLERFIYSKSSAVTVIASKMKQQLIKKGSK